MRFMSAPRPALTHVRPISRTGAVCLVVLWLGAASSSEAAPISVDEILYDNGAFSGNQSQKFNNDVWTVFDNFQISSLSNVTGLIWDQHHIDSTNVVYESTDLTFYDDVPSPGSLIASFNVDATLTPNGNVINLSTGYTYEATGLSLLLQPGTYWVGIHNVASGLTTWDNTSEGFGGPLSGRYQFSDDPDFPSPPFPGEFYNENGNHDSVFQVVGQQAVPEPSTMLLCSASLLGMIAYAGRRRRRDGCPVSDTLDQRSQQVAEAIGS